MLDLCGHVIKPRALGMLLTLINQAVSSGQGEAAQESHRSLIYYTSQTILFTNTLLLAGYLPIISWAKSQAQGNGSQGSF